MDMPTKRGRTAQMDLVAGKIGKRLVSITVLNVTGIWILFSRRRVSKLEGVLELGNVCSEAGAVSPFSAPEAPRSSG